MLPYGNGIWKGSAERDIESLTAFVICLLAEA